MMCHFKLLTNLEFQDAVVGDPAAAQAAVLAEAGHPEAPEAHQAGQAEPQDEVALRQPVGTPRPQGRDHP